MQNVVLVRAQPSISPVLVKEGLVALATPLPVTQLEDFSIQQLIAYDTDSNWAHWPARVKCPPLRHMQSKSTRAPLAVSLPQNKSQVLIFQTQRVACHPKPDSVIILHTSMMTPHLALLCNHAVDKFLTPSVRRMSCEAAIIFQEVFNLVPT